MPLYATLRTHTHTHFHEKQQQLLFEFPLHFPLGIYTHGLFAFDFWAAAKTKEMILRFFTKNIFRKLFFLLLVCLLFV